MTVARKDFPESRPWSEMKRSALALLVRCTTATLPRRWPSAIVAKRNVGKSLIRADVCARSAWAGTSIVPAARTAITAAETTRKRTAQHYLVRPSAPRQVAVSRDPAAPASG